MCHDDAGGVIFYGAYKNFPGVDEATRQRADTYGSFADETVDAVES